MDEAQLLLWRWSTIVQVSSLAMVAAFFWLLQRANPRPELRWWARAWTANLVALVVTTVYWLLQYPPLGPAITGIYMSAKLVFALALAQGAWMMTRNGHLFTLRQLLIGVAAYGVFAGLFIRGVEVVGLIQHSLMGAVLLALAAMLASSRVNSVVWFAAGVARDLPRA